MRYKSIKNMKNISHYFIGHCAYGKSRGIFIDKRLTGKKISNRFLKVEQNACQTVGFSVRYQMFTMNAEA